MAKSKWRILIVALATVLCCLALLITGTYALFSDTVTVENHLRAGTLKVTLVRENLTSYNVADDGTMTYTTNGTKTDFTNKTSENIFDIKDDTVIVPMSYFTADMVITNSGDVAFVYWIEVVTDADNTDKEFASQLTITVKHGETETSQSLDKGLAVGNSSNALGTVLVGGEAEFSVSLKFEDVSDNNLAKLQKASFDLVVYAVQAIS